MKHNNKKGQSALEFLTTYGWAFLVILIMIGALAYFGVLDPSRFLPDKCVATTGFSCVESRAQGAAVDAIQARLVNGGAKQVTLSAAPTVTISGSATCNTVAANHPTMGGTDWSAGTVDWNAGQELTLAIDCTTAPSAGERVNVLIEGSYTEVGSTLGSKPFELTLSTRVN